MSVKNSRINKVKNQIRQISTTTPLSEDAVFTSDGKDVREYDKLVGTCFSDKSGVLVFEFSSDGTNYDGESESYSYSANEKLLLDVEVLGRYARAVFTNGSSDQTVFRLYVDGKY